MLRWKIEFNPNKTPVKTLKEVLFGGTYFRNIQSNVTNKWYNNSWKEVSDMIGGIDSKYFNYIIL